MAYTVSEKWIHSLMNKIIIFFKRPTGPTLLNGSICFCIWYIFFYRFCGWVLGSVLLLHIFHLFRRVPEILQVTVWEQTSKMNNYNTWHPGKMIKTNLPFFLLFLAATASFDVLQCFMWFFAKLLYKYRKTYVTCYKEFLNFWKN